MKGINKQLLPLRGEAVLARSIRAFFSAADVGEILVVVSPGSEEVYQPLLQQLGETPVPVRLVPKGGSTRMASVFAGVEEVSGAADYIAVHDGARPLVSPEDIDRVIADAKAFGGAVLGVPCKDTVKRVGPDGLVAETPRRETLFAVQTPQVFRKADYLAAMADCPDISLTDDAQLFERTGRPVKLTVGSYENIKITTPEDIGAAQSILEKREGERI